MGKFCPKCKDQELETFDDKNEMEMSCPKCFLVVANRLGVNDDHHTGEGRAFVGSGTKFSAHKNGALCVSSTYKRFKVIEEHKKVVTVVLNKYTSSQAIEEEIMQMFQSLVFDEFYRSHSNKKLQCLAACTFIVLTNHNIPAVSSDIRVACECELKGFTSVLRKVKDLTNNKHYKCPEAMIEHMIEGLPSMQFRKRRVKKAMELVRLLRFMDCNDGMPWKSVAVHSSYLAELCEYKEDYSRPLPSFHSFATLNKVLGPSSKTFTSVKKKIMLLASKLKWCNTKVTARNYHIFIDDVLKFHQSCLEKFEEDHKNTVEARTEAGGNQTSSSVENVEEEGEKKLAIPVAQAKPLNVKTADDTTPYEFLTQPIPFVQRKRSCRDDTTSSGSKVMRIAPTSEQLLEDDLPESEMSKHILLPHELVIKINVLEGKGKR